RAARAPLSAGNRSADACHSTRQSPCACAGPPRSRTQHGRTCFAPSITRGTPAPPGQDLLPRLRALPVSWQTGLPFFSVHFLEDLTLHRLIGHNAFEPPVLSL